MQTKRLAALGGLALGLGTLSLSPTLAGAERLAPPSTDSSTVSPDTTVSQSQAAFAALLSGNEETPPTNSPAWGWAEFRPSADGTGLAYSARVFGLVGPTMAHLHLGAPGVAGPVVAPLEVPGDPGTSGCIDVHGMTTGMTGSGAEGCHVTVPPTTRPEPGSPTSTTGGATSTTEGSTSMTGGATATTGGTTGTVGGPTSTTQGMVPSATDPTSTTGPTTSTTGPAATGGQAAPASHSDPDCWGILHVSGPPASSGSPGTNDTSSTSEPEGDGQCGFADIQGTITASDLTGPLAGMTIQDLLADIRAGDIYMNLHTDVFPAGELRGQVVVSGSGAGATTGTSTSGPTTSTTAPVTSTTGATTPTPAAPTAPSEPTTSTTGGTTTDATTSNLPTSSTSTTVTTEATPSTGGTLTSESTTTMNPAA